MIYFVVYQFTRGFALISTVLTCWSGQTAAGFPLKGKLVNASTVNTGISMMVQFWVCRRSDSVWWQSPKDLSELWTLLFQLVSSRCQFYYTKLVKETFNASKNGKSCDSHLMLIFKTKSHILFSRLLLIIVFSSNRCGCGSICHTIITS